MKFELEMEFHRDNKPTFAQVANALRQVSETLSERHYEARQNPRPGSTFLEGGESGTVERLGHVIGIWRVIEGADGR